MFNNLICHFKNHMCHIFSNKSNIFFCKCFFKRRCVFWIKTSMSHISFLQIIPCNLTFIAYFLITLFFNLANLFIREATKDLNALIYRRNFRLIFSWLQNIAYFQLPCNEVIILFYSPARYSPNKLFSMRVLLCKTSKL